MELHNVELRVKYP